MRMNLQYLMDHGHFFDENKSDIEIPFQEDNEITCREAEESYTYIGIHNEERTLFSTRGTPSLLFWRFPEGRGSMQPWRYKLWEHRNKL